MEIATSATYKPEGWHKGTRIIRVIVGFWLCLLAWLPILIHSSLQGREVGGQSERANDEEEQVLQH